MNKHARHVSHAKRVRFVISVFVCVEGKLLVSRKRDGHVRIKNRTRQLENLFGHRGCCRCILLAVFPAVCGEFAVHLLN